MVTFGGFGTGRCEGSRAAFSAPPVGGNGWGGRFVAIVDVVPPGHWWVPALSTCPVAGAGDGGGGVTVGGFSESFQRAGVPIRTTDGNPIGNAPAARAIAASSNVVIGSRRAAI